MDEYFLKHAKKKILETDGLSVEDLAKKLGKSHSYTSRILSGEGAYKLRYTPVIREYIGFETFDDRNGNKMAVLDLIKLKTEDSLANSESVITQFTLLDSILPSNINIKDIKIVETPSEHCAPDYKAGNYVFVDTSDLTPEPPGVFLIWTGMGYRLQYCQHVISSNPPEVRLTSINTAFGYEAAQIRLEDAHIKGRVIGKISMTGA